MGQGIFNPIDRGSSTDGFYRTTAAGSFFSNNPVATFGYFSGMPLANFGWELNAPASVPVELMFFNAYAKFNPILDSLTCSGWRITLLSLCLRVGLP